MKEKGISLVALIVTIIIIILLTTIVGYNAYDILQKSERMTIEEELRNVEELVSINRAKIAVGKVEISSDYLATSEQINRFSGILSSEEIEKIESSGNYYFMNQEIFNTLFGNEVNVKDVRREYLINFEDKVIISSAGSDYMIGEIK